MEEIKKLYDALISNSSPLYENLRRELISKYGYNKFREIQREAFKMITVKEYKHDN